MSGKTEENSRNMALSRHESQIRLDTDTSTTGHQRVVHEWDHLLKQLQDLSSITVQKNRELETRVAQLEEELTVWKQARSVTIENAEREKRRFEEERVNLQSKIHSLESLQDSMVLCVIDGDGNIFADHLIASGLEGGRTAAQLLTKRIAECLMSTGFDRQRRFTFWLTIYFNRKGLQNTLIRNGVCSTEQFDAFCVGISQASPRFVIVDVGQGKEAADTKIKEFLQTYSRFPQTCKVFFGGGHDNGYHPTLTALENEGLLDKVILLRGYHDVAADLKALRVPILELDELFRSTKFPGSPGSPRSRFSSSVSSNTPNGEEEIIFPFTKARRSTEDIETISKQLKLLNPNFSLTKQNPPPCNEYYLLKKCPRGETCKYGHEYLLTEENITNLAINAKKSPCSAVRKGSKCSFGDRCIWGHICPKGSECPHNATGKCWFKGPLAHLPK